MVKVRPVRMDMFDGFVLVAMRMPRRERRAGVRMIVMAVVVAVMVLVN